jgi:hypothetical protein
MFSTYDPPGAQKRNPLWNVAEKASECEWLGVDFF